MDDRLNIPDYSPSQQERDAFRMKAISILMQNGDLRSSIPSLLQAPIEVDISCPNDGWDLIHLSQKFENAGRKLCLQGQFLKNRSKKGYSIPVSSSFKVVTD